MKYSDYLKVLKKMELFNKTLHEMKEKKISEISEIQIQQIADLAYDGYYDEQSEIWDLYFVDPEDVFSLFAELGEAERRLIFNYDPDHLKLVFCLSFYYQRNEIGADYIEDIDEAIETYKAALAVFKAWEDEDNQEDKSGRNYNVLVIQQSTRNYRIDSKTGERSYCWERQETIRTNYSEKLYKIAEDIIERIPNDYYQEKIFIDLNTGEEIVLFDKDGIDTEPTDRARYFLNELRNDL